MCTNKSQQEKFTRNAAFELKHNSRSSLLSYAVTCMLREYSNFVPTKHYTTKLSQQQNHASKQSLCQQQNSTEQEKYEQRKNITTNTRLDDDQTIEVTNQIERLSKEFRLVKINHFDIFFSDFISH